LADCSSPTLKCDCRDLCIDGPCASETEKPPRLLYPADINKASLLVTETIAEVSQYRIKLTISNRVLPFIRMAEIPSKIIGDEMDFGIINSPREPLVSRV